MVYFCFMTHLQRPLNLKKSLGQHFLKDELVCQLIVECPQLRLLAGYAEVRCVQRLELRLHVWVAEKQRVAYDGVAAR